MLFAAAMFLLGHLCALFAHWSVGMLPAICTVVLYAVLSSGRLAFLLLGVGYLVAAAQADERLDDRLLPAFEGATVTLTGVVSSLPKETRGAIRFEFEPVHESDIDSNQTVPRRIAVTWYRSQYIVTPGDRWRLTLRLRRPRGGVNPQGFDYERWLFRRGIGATGYVVENPENERIATSSGFPSRVLRLREAVADEIARYSADDRWRGLIAGIAIGDRRLIDEQQWQVLRETGTAHLMAISGLHVGMAATIGGAVGFGAWLSLPFLRRRWARRDAMVVAGLVLAVAYSVLAGLALPTRRALIMLAAIALVLLLRRSSSALNVLGLALFLVLLIDPMSPLDPGFWLSFVAVGSLSLVLTGRLRESSRPPRFLLGMIRSQYAVAVGLLPLTISFFGLSAPAGLLANLVLIPLFAVFFVPMTLSMLLAMGCGFDRYVAWAIAGLENGFELVWRGLETVLILAPAIALPVPTPTMLALAALGALYLLAPWPGRRLGVLMMLPLFLAPATPFAKGDLKLTVLDVGQGLAVVIETQNRVAVYDPGPRYASGGDAATRVLIPYLTSAGHDRVNKVIVSHGDSDHAGGLAALRARFPDTIFLAGGGKRRPSETQTCRAGQEWSWNDIRFRILHPDSDAWDGNNASCVLLIETPGCRILLSGDIQSEAERRMLGSIGAVDAALVAHHGSNSSSTERWVRELRPRLALVSAGFDNRWGFPTPAVATRWQEAGAHVVNTGTDGALTLTVKGATSVIELRRERLARRALWRELAYKPGVAGDPALAATVSGPAPAAVSCRDPRRH